MVKTHNLLPHQNINRSSAANRASRPINTNVVTLASSPASPESFAQLIKQHGIPHCYCLDGLNDWLQQPNLRHVVVKLVFNQVAINASIM